MDTRDLPRRPGSMRTVTRTVPAPADVRGELIGPIPGSDLVLDLRLESVSEGVLVSGTIQVMLTGECARCLDVLTSPLEVDIQQLFVYPGNEIDEDDEDDEIGQLVDDYVDLEPVLRDAVVLALPLAPVCREDCPGLCPQCGARLADVDPGHRHDEVDPRWAALRAVGTTDRQRNDEDQEN
ncbi:MAG TPA: YceD family protein [Acidothermaceae bacterium]